MQNESQKGACCVSIENPRSSYLWDFEWGGLRSLLLALPWTSCTTLGRSCVHVYDQTEQPLAPLTPSSRWIIGLFHSVLFWTNKNLDTRHRCFQNVLLLMFYLWLPVWCGLCNYFTSFKWHLSSSWMGQKKLQAPSAYKVSPLCTQGQEVPHNTTL